MNRAVLYGLLVPRLERYRAMEREALLARVNQPSETEVVLCEGCDVLIDVRVFWQDERKRGVCVHATASGPGTWMMQRLDERIVVRFDR